VRPHQLSELWFPDDASAWTACGFRVANDRFSIGQTTVHLDSNTPTLSASIEGIDVLDGLALRSASPAGDERAEDGVAHPITAFAIDHVVVRTPAPDRTTAAFEAAGLDARKVRLIETPKGAHRQTFFWLGDVVCEVVGPDSADSDEPSSWWGWALSVADLESAVELLGDNTTPIKDAVQPGRRVATVRHGELTTPTLLISPHLGAGASA